jgi:hypothetical protein
MLTKFCSVASSLRSLVYTARRTVKMRLKILAFCIVGSFIGPAPISARVDDTLAKRWVARGFLTLDCTSPAPQPSDISQRFQDPEKVKQAWRYLKGCRDSGHASSPEAVAAENYLYIRWVAGFTGDTALKVFPWSYYLLKIAGSKAGFLQRLRSNPDNPVSDPDPDVRDWGNRGYEDGILDYEHRTGERASLKSASAEVAWNFLADTFY